MERLKKAAEEGDIDTLFELIRQDQMILERIDEEPFTDSPLHIAACVGSTHFALEIMLLKPSFGTKLNADGLSPLHLALRNGHIDTAKSLAEFDPRLIHVRGRGGITPLHYVAECDNIDLLADFLVACPASIKNLTIRRETVVHVAVKNESLRAFEVLLGWLDRTTNLELLNWKDDQGNAVIHLAVSTNQSEILRLLIGKVKLNEKNIQGFTALDIAEKFNPWQQNESIRKILHSAKARKASLIPEVSLADAMSRRPRRFSKWIVRYDAYLDVGLSGDIRNALLVVAVLIATATYQAILQPPGGFSEDDGSKEKNKLGKVVMGKRYYYPFTILNSIAFAASMGVIVLLLPKGGPNALFYICLTFMFMSYLCAEMGIARDDTLNFVSVTLIVTYFVWYLFLVARRAHIKPRGSFRSIIQNENDEILRAVYVSKYSEQSGG